MCSNLESERPHTLFVRLDEVGAVLLALLDDAANGRHLTLNTNEPRTTAR